MHGPSPLLQNICAILRVVILGKSQEIVICNLYGVFLLYTTFISALPLSWMLHIHLHISGRLCRTSQAA